MRTQDFFFDLPEALIAQEPSGERGDDRLMVLRRPACGDEPGSETAPDCKIEHRLVRDLPELLPEDTLLVLNNSRVRKARVYGTSRESGGTVEFLLIKQTAATEWEALCKKTKRKKAGSVFVFSGDNGAMLAQQGAASAKPAKQKTVTETAETAIEAEIMRHTEDGVILRFNRPIDDAYLDRHGHIPLPPYIRRNDTAQDAARYQNVYAKPHGSIASPTAGLHLTEALLAKIRERGIETAFITLHVGLGTFLPVRTERVEDHRMHEEAYTIDEKCAEQVNCALRERRPVTAVGTTSLRCLESAWRDGRVEPGSRTTGIFIYPGYEFNVVDSLFTNFHTPCSTLLMLVCALAGRDRIMAAYQKAVSEHYRFFSYGDAMLIG
ncbi:MAG: tRNA preQ1(34) S-adenosylmethionine ribosyltransferase-isomerase QueA [Spirochaetaceae bacterium]|jgi:S-adenosylmethionine:tRNA ribosyltransferase-isomerase|nr:tRNA preQ1(34) S-adenosylmethionine ribosyltransferase-isomerase QueA [Spirochaetaceae bacterium]